MGDTRDGNANYNSTFVLPRIVAKQDRGEVLTVEEFNFAKKIGLQSVKEKTFAEHLTNNVAFLAIDSQLFKPFVKPAPTFICKCQWAGVGIQTKIGRTHHSKPICPKCGKTPRLIPKPKPLNPR
jgi:hypothetical protein